MHISLVHNYLQITPARLAAAMPRATDGLTPAPLQTPFFAGQKGWPGKVGHNVALRHSADLALLLTILVAVMYKVFKNTDHLVHSIFKYH